MALNYFKAKEKFRVLTDTAALDDDPNNSKSIATNVFKAIYLDDDASLQWYLDQGFSVNYHNKFGETVVHYACKCSAVRCLHELIERKAFVGVSSINGRTPLHMALWHHREISLPIIRLICDQEPSMLLSLDWLKALPTDNICPTQWPVVCDFFNLSVDHYFEKLKTSMKRVSTGIMGDDVSRRADGSLDWNSIKSRENDGPPQFKKQKREQTTTPPSSTAKVAGNEEKTTTTTVKKTKAKT